MTTLVRARVTIRGAVQGVGFRPFVYRLARELGLRGGVRNGSAGVVADIEGDAGEVDAFLRRLETERPAAARVTGTTIEPLAGVSSRAFEILPSEAEAPSDTWILPDLAPCGACVRELFDPADRRFRYPFLNCTACGPRYTIIEALPYDRARGSMKGFELCAACRAEYESPDDRRFHAQPIACPACGPTAELDGLRGDAAVREAVRALLQGAIVGVKGIGGFHLMADARDAAALRRLRARKAREEKPFALLVASLEEAGRIADVGPIEATLLSSPEAPIVLVTRRTSDLPEELAPGNPDVGLLLPSSPLQHLIAREAGIPLVATSGNVSGDPIAIGNEEAVARLGGIADRFLVHDRPILRPVDDSVVRVVAGRPLMLRRARGYAPLPIRGSTSRPLVAVGAQLKSAVAIAKDGGVFLSQHLGDLGVPAAFDAFRGAIDDLSRILGARPEAVAHDAHPDYGSTRHAEALGLPQLSTQHHHAHVLSCLADNGIAPPVLGVAWDGGGHGLDGSVWGGEFLNVDATGFERFAHLRTFALPGGDRASREPRRSALALLHEARLPVPDLLASRFTDTELRALHRALERGVRCPRTSSAGRLFDGVAALLGLRDRVSFEGQAAMELEFLARKGRAADAYPVDGGDWEPLLSALLDELRRGRPREEIARRFHTTLARMIVSVAARAGRERVALSGGCFQNALLTESAVAELRHAGFDPVWHRDVPPNDGGVALGQAIAGGASCA